MDFQEPLGNYAENLKPKKVNLVELKPNKKHLEEEKDNFIELMSSFIDNVNLEEFDNYNGRPKFDLKDILKSLLMMSYTGMSYKRVECDLRSLKEKDILLTLPKRSTLNKYMLDKNIKETVSQLIEMTSLFFLDNEDTIILDATWVSPRMYTGGYKKVYDRKKAPLEKVRKVHVACLKNSKIICCARASEGTLHESKMFKELVSTSIKNGFQINTLLADAGYTSKENIAFCDAVNIKGAFINFRNNVVPRRGKSCLWRKQVELFKEHPEKWKEVYRFRVIVEGVFSSIKRKSVNYLRSRKDDAQDTELLLKCLVYNFNSINKYHKVV